MPQMATEANSIRSPGTGRIAPSRIEKARTRAAPSADIAQKKSEGRSPADEHRRDRRRDRQQPQDDTSVRRRDALHGDRHQPRKADDEAELRSSPGAEGRSTGPAAEKREDQCRDQSGECAARGCDEPGIERGDGEPGHRQRSAEQGHRGCAEDKAKEDVIVAHADARFG